MPDAVLIRGSNGTVIDTVAMEAELNGAGFTIDFRHGPLPDLPVDPTKTFRYSDHVISSAEIRRIREGRGLVVDSENFADKEWVEGVARLLRRVLPAPAKVISHMDPVQWSDFQGSKADA